MNGRAFLFALSGLVVVRMSLGAHAPAVVDAHVCLVALALLLVGRAPQTALAVAGLVVGGALLSIPTSWDPWISFIALPAALGPAAFFILASAGSWRTALLAGVGVGGALNAVAAIVQRTWTWPDALRRMNELGLDANTVGRLAEARPLGLSVSPDLAGGMCLLGAFAAAALALEVTDKRARIALFATALVSVSALVVIRSFGTGLALVVGVGVSALLLALRRSGRLGVVVGGVGALAGAVALGAAFALRGADALAQSAGERLENWKAAWAMFVDHPLLGVGFMRFPAAYLDVRAPGSNLTRYAHSTPLEHLAETGLVGGVLLAVAIAVAVRAVWRRRAQLRPADILLAGAAVAAGVRFAIDYDGHVAQTASVAAVIWGLLLADGTPEPAPTFQRRLAAGFAMVSLGVVVLLAWRQSALESEDDGVLAAYSSVVPFDVEPRLARAAHAVDALSVCSTDDDCRDSRLILGQTLDGLCTRTHPPSVALVLRARARLITHDPAGALVDVDAALQVDPGNAAAHQLGIIAARARGDDDASIGGRLAAAHTWGVAAP